MNLVYFAMGSWLHIPVLAKYELIICKIPLFSFASFRAASVVSLGTSSWQTNTLALTITSLAFNTSSVVSLEFAPGIITMAFSPDEGNVHCKKV